VLRDPAHKAKWLTDCKAIAARLQTVRELTHAALVAKKVKGKWDHILSQCGMFTYTGLGADIVTRLRDEFHIYLLKSGRVNMAALHTGNIPYFTDALVACLGTN
jgi:aspartate aminotransferase